MKTTIKRHVIQLKEEEVEVKLPFYCAIENLDTYYKRITKDSITTLTRSFEGWYFDHIKTSGFELNQDEYDNRIEPSVWEDAVKEFKEDLKNL